MSDGKEAQSAAALFWAEEFATNEIQRPSFTAIQ